MDEKRNQHTFVFSDLARARPSAQKVLVLSSTEVVERWHAALGGVLVKHEKQDELFATRRGASQRASELRDLARSAHRALQHQDYERSGPKLAHWTEHLSTRTFNVMLVVLGANPIGMSDEEALERLRSVGFRLKATPGLGRSGQSELVEVFGDGALREFS